MEKKSSKSSSNYEAAAADDDEKFKSAHKKKKKKRSRSFSPFELLRGTQFRKSSFQEEEEKKSNKNKKKATDDCGQIDSIIGDFGKYQLMIFIFKVLIGATSAFNNLGVTFYAPKDFISFWCADTTIQQQQQQAYDALATNPTTTTTTFASFDNATTGAYELLGTPSPGVPLLAQARLSVDPHQHGPAATNSMRQLLTDFVFNDVRAQRHESNVYLKSDTPKSLRKECDYLSLIDNKRHKCTTYEYDTGIWMSTIIDEWNLVCERSLFISITQSLYMAGFIVSFLMFGYLSDRFGRWNSLLLGALIEIASGFGCAFAGSVRQFMIFRFLLGLGNAGRSSSSYLIMIEWTGQAWRMHISTLGSLGWVLGYCTMPWITMYFLHFRHMQLFVCFYESIFLLWLLFLPESPRWLLAHRRFGEAHEVLLRAARANGLLLQPPAATAAAATPDASEAKLCERELDPSVNSSSDGSMLMSPLGASGRETDFKHRPEADEDCAIPCEASRPSFARKRLNSMINGDDPSGDLNIPAHEMARNNSDARQDSHHQQNGVQRNFVHVQNQQKALNQIENGKQAAASASSERRDQVADHRKHHKARGGVRPYTLDEFEVKFALLAETIASKEFSKNENKLSILDLFKWHNLRRYFFILAFAWAINSFIYYGIALNVGDFGARNLFVSFSIAGASELPSIIFTMICMKMLPRKTTNVFLFSLIFLLCALQVPLKYYQLGWLQQFTMILAKLFNSCSFTVILYQTMELFPTSIRQTAYSSCALSGRIGSILAPFIKELSQMTNNLVPPVIYAVLSLMEIVLIRHLPETQGHDLADTLLEAEKFKGTDKRKQHNAKDESCLSAISGKQLPA